MLSRIKALDQRDRPFVKRSEGVSQRLPSVYRFIFSREIVQAQKTKQLIGDRFVSKKGRASAATAWVQGARTRRIGGSQKLSGAMSGALCYAVCARFGRKVLVIAGAAVVREKHLRPAVLDYYITFNRLDLLHAHFHTYKMGVGKRGAY